MVKDILQIVANIMQLRTSHKESTQDILYFLERPLLKLPCAKI